MKSNFTLVLLCFFAACSSAETEGTASILPEQTYLNVMVELQLLDALVFTSDSTLSRDSLKQVLFDEYKIDQSTYEEADRFYRSDIQEHQARLDSALRMIKREQQRLTAIQDSVESARKN